MKNLATQGRTIICTIHQPSARLFQEFEQVYILAMGKCLYQGGTEKMVPYLQSVDLPCPMYHNPADYSKHFLILLWKLYLWLCLLTIVYAPLTIFHVCYCFCWYWPNVLSKCMIIHLVHTVTCIWHTVRKWLVNEFAHFAIFRSVGQSAHR